MRTVLIPLLTCFINISGIAQPISITFKGTGASDKIDSITATNLSANKKVTLPGSGTLVLGMNNWIPSDPEPDEKALVFPNPFSGQTTYQLFMNQAQALCVSVQNLSGQVIADYRGFAGPGQHLFTIGLKTAGLYLISSEYDSGTIHQQMICIEGKRQENSIAYLGSAPANRMDPSYTDLKSSPENYFLEFTPGDILLFRCYSDHYITVKTGSPAKSEQYQIEFIDCTDEDGKFYPVVTIGDQTWMAENLAYLPKVDPSVDGSVDAPYLYVYGCMSNDIDSAKNNENFKTYGVLYNWPAAIIACPSGWHLPSGTEWESLCNDPVSPDETGFNPSPGGIRCSNGNFSSLGISSCYWSSTDTDRSHAYGRKFDFEKDLSGSNVEEKSSGFSVRCIKNPSEFTVVPSVNTYPVTGITPFSAEGTGNLISNHAESAYERGICWSTGRNPTVSDNQAIAGAGLGIFTVPLTGLTSNTTYYLRAFATNTAGTGYGDEISFTTLEGGTFTDPRDMKSYRYVRIGKQNWMAENLAWLPAVSPPARQSVSSPLYYVYAYEGTDLSAAKATQNYSAYGVLYNWNAALGACPAGWHLPDNREWRELIHLAGGDSIAGQEMKSRTGWNDFQGKSGNGNNSWGFTALPGGEVEPAGIFLNAGNYGSYWSGEPGEDSNALMWLLDNFNRGIFLHSYSRGIAVSVRCLMN